MLLKSSTPRRYPAIEENTTLIAKPAFVICLKSEVIFFIETFSVGVFKFSDYLNGAKVMVRKRFDKKRIINTYVLCFSYQRLFKNIFQTFRSKKHQEVLFGKNLFLSERK